MSTSPLLLLISFTITITTTTAASTVSVADYGAIGDGLHYDTTPIQTAINSCSSTPTCTHILFPPNHTYLTSTIHLKSHTTLLIPAGATILAGTHQHDYPSQSSRWYLLIGENVTGAGITGGGVIDGNGGAFVERRDARKNVMVSWNQTGDCVGDECRPRLVGFIGARDVRVSDISLNQPAYWCLHLVRCDNSMIQNVSIFGDFDTPNNDGIDIEDSNNTIITRCHIDTGDDAICPKSSAGPVYNLTVTDCWIRTKSSAIKLGSASFYDFRRLYFNNITIVDSHRGLAMQIRDGGNVSDVIFSNIIISTRYYDPSWWGRAEPIYITTCPRDSTSKAGSISNLLFANISAVSENGVFLSGSKGGLLSNLKFRNVNITYRRWTNYSGGLYDYRPGCQGLVNHTTAGMVMEHISGLSVKGMKMTWSKSSLKRWNNPIEFKPSTVNNISFHDFLSDIS